MTWDIRSHTPDEIWDYRTAVARGFGYDPIEQPGERDLYLERHEPERTRIVTDEGSIVATSIAYSFQLPVPGGQVVPTGGISDVTVATTHRRQGILREMMRHQLEDSRDRGETFAALWASESGIYTRFGFGMSSHHERWNLPTAHGQFGYQPEVAGSVRFASESDMRTVAPQVYERMARRRPGMLLRPDAWWNLQLFDPAHRRKGMSSYYYAIYEEDDEPRGYAQYRIRNEWTDKRPDKTMFLEELVAETDVAHAALWRFCLDVDMVTEIITEHQPVDDALWWMLADPRWLTRVPFDAVWLRVIDPVKALSSRVYDIENSVVIEVRDDYCDWVAGRYLVDGGPGGAVAKKTTQEPDLVIWDAGLASAYLGGVPFSRLHRAGRLEAKSTDTLRRADLMFSHARAPYCPFEF